MVIINIAVMKLFFFLLLLSVLLFEKKIHLLLNSDERFQSLEYNHVFLKKKIMLCSHRKKRSILFLATFFTI